MEALYYKNYLGKGAKLTLTLLDRNASLRFLYGNDNLEQLVKHLSEGVGFKTSAFIKNRSLSSVILPLNIYYIIGKYQVEILKG